MSLAEVRPIAPVQRIGSISPRVAYVAATVVMAALIVAGFALSIATWTPAAVIALLLVAITAVWISGGAITATLGLMSEPVQASRVPDDWSPSEKTAILVTLCGEDPKPLARHLKALRRALNTVGLGQTTQIFVLSDTSGGTKIGECPERC